MTPNIRAYRTDSGRLFKGATRRGMLGDDKATQPLVVMIVRAGSERMAPPRGCTTWHRASS